MSQVEQGFGCMGFSAFYSSAKNTTPDQARSVVHHVLASGVTLLNTATFYGELNEQGFGANLRLLRHCLQGVERSSYRLMVKIGMDTRCPVEKTGTSWVMRGDAESLRKDVDYALEQLGTDYLDIIVLCRVPSDVAIEESVAAMKQIVLDGKAHHIGLSEASASTIRRAHAVHPLFCIEQEWSLWARDIEDDIVPACKELGIRVVAYSPLGRGFLTGTIRSRDSPDVDPSDYRFAANPKFQEGHFETNLELVSRVEALAARKGITVGQLALAWLHAQGNFVIPIPGTTRAAHFDQNAAARSLSLSSEELDEVDRIFHRGAASGERYVGNHFTFHKN